MHLHAVFTTTPGRRNRGHSFGNPNAATVRQWRVDWDAFRAENPQVGGSVEEWLDRLARALEAVTASPGSQ